MTQSLLRREVVAEGVRLSSVERDAEGEGKAPLLLLHGLVASGASFADMMAELPADRRIVALNLLDAQPLDENDELDVTFEGLAGLVVAFLPAAGLDQPVLVGHSHGGALALRIAVSQPEVLRGMVLLCPAHPFGGYDSRVVRFYLSRVGGLFAKSLRWLPRWLQQVGQSRMMGPGKRLTRRQVDSYREVFRAQHVIPRILRLLRSWETDMQALSDQMERRSIEIPTLLVWGDHDAVVPISTAAALQRNLVRCEQYTLRGVGHLPPDEAPQECASLIQAWLVECDAAEIDKEVS